MMASKRVTASSTHRRPGKKETAKRSWWLAWPPKAVCSRGCGARCCKGSFISLTPQEAERLPRLAHRLGLLEPEIVPNEKSRLEGANGPVQEYIMYALPCAFLSKDNLCRIYRDRPDHCRAFPDQVREWCPLSWRKYGDGG